MKQLVPLYGCRPLGAGTPFTESLTSFVGRLAIRRHLMPSSIFVHLVRPLVPEGLRPESFWRGGLCWQNSVALDGHYEITEALVGALSELTRIDDLSLHTLLPWRRLITGQHSGAVYWGRRRWCASCLAESRERGADLWEPLLWRVAVVKRCPVHRAPLSRVCPGCKATQGIMPGVVPIGTCRNCGRYLEIGDRSRTKSAKRLAGSVDDWEWQVSKVVGRLLASQKEMAAHASPQGFLSLLRGLQCRPDVPSRLGLSRYLGVNPVGLKAWLQGEGLWAFEPFIRACMRVRADPLAVAVFPHRRFSVVEKLEQDLFLVSHGRPSSGKGLKRPSCRRWGKSEWEQFEEQLGRVLEVLGTERFSIETISNYLGVSPSTFRKRYPKEYRRIKAGHARFIKRRVEQRPVEAEKTMRAAFQELIDEDEHPRQDKVFERAGLNPLYAMSELYGPIWRKIRREYDSGARTVDHGSDLA